MGGGERGCHLRRQHASECAPPSLCGNVPRVQWENSMPQRSELPASIDAIALPNVDRKVVKKIVATIGSTSWRPRQWMHVKRHLYSPIARPKDVLFIGVFHNTSVADRGGPLSTARPPWCYFWWGSERMCIVYCANNLLKYIMSRSVLWDLMNLANEACVLKQNELCYTPQ